LSAAGRSSLYYQAVPVSAKELATKHRIDAIYTDYPLYGSRRIQAVLNKDEQIDISRQRVQRYMREMGIAGTCPGPNLNRWDSGHRIYPYLLRDVTAARNGHIWGVDITYIRLTGGWPPPHPCRNLTPRLMKRVLASTLFLLIRGLDNGVNHTRLSPLWRALSYWLASLLLCRLIRHA
jgi:hypothetical protein